MSEACRIEPNSVTPWLTKHEAAKRARVTVGVIEAAMREGELRYAGGGRAGGRRVVIHEAWVDAWLEALAETTKAP